MDNLPDGARRAYHDVANDPKYQHFVRIPERILQCIDYFGIECDRKVTRSRLHVYYLFIGVVDDEIDSGRVETGKVILQNLNTSIPDFDEEAIRSRIRLVTEMLKFHVSDQTYPVMVEKLRELHGEVVSERSATSIDSYIRHRRYVGALTAELSYLLIRPGLRGNDEGLCEFMKRVGAIGCLIDSLIDLQKDRRLGLLGFKPGVTDYTELIGCIVRDGLRVSLRHLGLSGLFVRAIIDNVRDRFRPDRHVSQHSFVSDRKDEAASVV